MTDAEIRENIKKYKNGDYYARELIVEGSQNLVRAIARRYAKNEDNYNDLCQEGSLGLLHAIEKFDNDQNTCKFSTYATHWIKQYITRAKNNDYSDMTIPEYAATATNKIRKAEQQYYADNQKSPTMKDLSDITGIKEKNIAFLQSYSYSIVSLDAPLNESETEDDLLNLVEDESAQMPFKDVEDNGLLSALEDVLNTLTEKEREVIILRYGLDRHPSRTLEEVGSIMGLTKERARQIETQALTKMRHPCRANILKDFLS